MKELRFTETLDASNEVDHYKEDRQQKAIPHRACSGKPNEWSNAIPYIDEDYDGDDELNDLTCAEVFIATVEAREKAEKERRDKELEEKLQVKLFEGEQK